MGDRMEAVVRRRGVHTMPDGRTVEIHALGLGDYVAARDRALEQYKRHRISTWTHNADLLPPDEKLQWIREAFERAEALTIEDLPKKKIKLPKRDGAGKILRDHKTGEPILRETEVEYTAWWMAETADGRLYMTWLAIRKGDPTFTLDDTDKLFADAAKELETVADKIGDLSEPTLGNSSAPAQSDALTPGEKREQRRRRRRIGH